MTEDLNSGLPRTNPLARVRNSWSLFQSNVCIFSFSRGVSYCPFYRGASYSGVSARGKLSVQVQPLNNRSPPFLTMVGFQTSAFESRHRWKLASSTLFFNEFVYRIVPAVLLILCVHCFAVKPSHHHCHIMQQQAFTFHMTYVLVLFQDTIICLLA